jgi:hypothetical protein
MAPYTQPPDVFQHWMRSVTMWMMTLWLAY